MRNAVYFVLFLLAASLVSCRDTATLEQHIQGSWTSTTPQQVALPGVARAMLATTYDFHAIEKGDSGAIGLTAQLSVALEPATSAGRLNSLASVAIKGTWRPLSDDEIAIDLDPATATCALNPATAELILQTSSSPRHREPLAPEAFDAGYAELLKQEVTKLVLSRLKLQGRRDNIVINDGMMQWDTPSQGQEVLVKPGAGSVVAAG